MAPSSGPPPSPPAPLPQAGEGSVRVLSSNPAHTEGAEALLILPPLPSGRGLGRGALSMAPSSGPPPSPPAPLPQAGEGGVRVLSSNPAHTEGAEAFLIRPLSLQGEGWGEGSIDGTEFRPTTLSPSPSAASGRGGRSCSSFKSCWRFIRRCGSAHPLPRRLRRPPAAGSRPVPAGCPHARRRNPPPRGWLPPAPPGLPACGHGSR